MPYITVEGGKLTNEQKKQLIEGLTIKASEIMHIPPEFFMITIKEFTDSSIGIGGKTIEIVKEEYMNNH